MKSSLILSFVRWLSSFRGSAWWRKLRGAAAALALVWLVLWLAMPMGFWGQFAAFALFRFFDAAKPGPVAWADSLFKGFGWRGAFGILFDDLVAAFCTLLAIAAWRVW